MRVRLAGSSLGHSAGRCSAGLARQLPVFDFDVDRYYEALAELSRAPGSATIR